MSLRLGGFDGFDDFDKNFIALSFHEIHSATYNA